jgi:hypothetical protein
MTNDQISMTNLDCELVSGISSFPFSFTQSSE